MRLVETFGVALFLFQVLSTNFVKKRCFVVIHWQYILIQLIVALLYADGRMSAIAPHSCAMIQHVVMYVSCRLKDMIARYFHLQRKDYSA